MSPSRYFITFIAYLACSGFSVADSERTFVITYPSTSISEIPKNHIRSIFTMRLRQWPNGSPITLVTMADDHPVHINFVQATVRLFPHKLRKNWDKLIYSGTGQAPIEVKTEAEMIDYVSKTPGTIGYVSKEPVNENVTVLKLL